MSGLQGIMSKQYLSIKIPGAINSILCFLFKSLDISSLHIACIMCKVSA